MPTFLCWITECSGLQLFLIAVFINMLLRLTLFIAKGFVSYFCYIISQVTVSLTNYIPSIILGPFSLERSVSYSLLDVVLYLISHLKLDAKQTFVSIHIHTLYMYNLCLTFGFSLNVLLVKKCKTVTLLCVNFCFIQYV